MGLGTRCYVKKQEIQMRLSITFIGPDCVYFDCNINFTKKSILCDKNSDKQQLRPWIEIQSLFYKYSLV